MPEAVVALGEGKRIVGRLRFESDGRRQYSQFEYDEAWLAAEDSTTRMRLDMRQWMKRCHWLFMNNPGQ